MAKAGRPPKKQRRLKGGPPRKPSKYNLFIKRMTKGGKMTLKQAAARWRKGPKARAPTRAPATRTSRRKPRKVSTGGRKRVGFNTQKIYGLVRKAALLGPAVAIAVTPGASMESKIEGILAAYTGFKMSDGTFNFSRLMKGYGPVLGATVATYGIPKLAGIIRGI